MTFWVGQSRRFDDSKPAAQNKTKPFQARMFHSLILTYQASFWLYAHSGVSVASSLALPVVRNLFETITTRSQLCHFDEITLARSHLDVAGVSDQAAQDRIIHRISQSTSSEWDFILLNSTNFFQGPGVFQGFQGVSRHFPGSPALSRVSRTEFPGRLGHIQDIRPFPGPIQAQSRTSMMIPGKSA